MGFLIASTMPLCRPQVLSDTAATAVGGTAPVAPVLGGVPGAETKLEAAGSICDLGTNIFRDLPNRYENAVI